MAERTPNETKIVKHFLAAKGIITFTNDDTQYTLGDAVIKASNFEKYPLNKGDKVEVGIKEDIVVFLKKQMGKSTQSVRTEESAKKEAATEPNPPLADGSTRQLTVFAVAANKKVVKFTEIKDAGWISIDPKLQEKDYEAIGLVGRSVVSVTIVDNTVVAVAKVASEPAKSSPEAASATKPAPATTSAPAAPKPAPEAAPAKKWTPPNASSNKDNYWEEKAKLDKEHYDVKDSEKQYSIEAQCSVGQACQVVGMMAANIDPKPTANVLNSMISSIAKSNFALIQELKNK